jgi:hypothetical protein
MGATLSPTSAIFFTTTPPNGARMTVFCSWASAKARSAFAWASWASAMLHAARRGVALVHGHDPLGGEVLRELQLANVLGEVGLGSLDRRLRAHTDAS